MHFPRLTLRIHLILLLSYALFTVGLIMLPVLLAGFPYKLTWLILAARQFERSGMMPANSTPLLVYVISWLHPLIRWDDMVGWTAVSAAFFAASLFPWWWTIRRLFDVRVAWLSTVLLSFLPQYWQEVIEFSGYAPALFFLFLGFAFYVSLRDRHHLAAVMAVGLCMGAVVATNHAFITFPPWLLVSYLWQGRKQTARALGAAALACICGIVIFILPLLPIALRPGLSTGARISAILPSGATPGVGHLYPDRYTYDFLRAEYDARLQLEMQHASFLERQANENYGIIFGALKTGFITSVSNGLWLFVNVLPSFFFEETVGGIFLWLFIVPGIVVLWRERRVLLLQLGGLWLWIEFCVRFLLHFGRAHLNDIAWMLALFAAVGIASAVTAIVRQRTSLRPALLMAGVLFVSAVQLLQANRTTLAKRYTRSDVPLIYAATNALHSVPSNAVVAHPRKDDLFFFSPQTSVSLHPDTIDYLSKLGRLREPFAHYGIQYILGYNPGQTQNILAAVPGIRVVPLPDPPPPVPLTELSRYLLNLTR